MKNFYCFKLIHNRIFIGISLLLISFFGFLNFASAEISGKEQTPPSVLYVNDGSTDGDKFCNAVGTTDGDGTIGNPCLRINDAISRASSGDTIYVDAGTYTYISEGSPVPAGLIKVTKGVVIKAVPETRPIIDGTGADGVFKIHPSALSDGNCVVIEGFEITGDPATGIAITMQGCYQVTPAKVIIKDNWVHGMIAGINFGELEIFCRLVRQVLLAMWRFMIINFIIWGCPVLMRDAVFFLKICLVGTMLEMTMRQKFITMNFPIFMQKTLLLRAPGLPWQELIVLMKPLICIYIIINS